jgi:hypothetical protein
MRLIARLAGSRTEPQRKLLTTSLFRRSCQPSQGDSLYGHSRFLMLFPHAALRCDNGCPPTFNWLPWELGRRNLLEGCFFLSFRWFRTDMATSEKSASQGVFLQRSFQLDEHDQLSTQSLDFLQRHSRS